jgi:hypothetical protein
LKDYSIYIVFLFFFTAPKLNPRSTPTHVFDNM